MPDKKKINIEKGEENDASEWMLEGKEYKEILPSFKPRKNTVYSIKLLTYPKEVSTGKISFYTVKILRDGMKLTMVVNNSFRYHLTRLYKQQGDLLGKILLINKNDDGYFSIQLA